MEKLVRISIAFDSFGVLADLALVVSKRRG
jgi:hypothetical protein